MNGPRHVAGTSQDREIPAVSSAVASLLTPATEHLRPGADLDELIGGVEPHGTVVREVISPRDRVQRVVDAIVSTVALVSLSPLFGAISLAIVLDSSGSPFYLQWRTGYRGRRFRMVKFRTMVHNAEDLRGALRDRSHLSDPDFKIANDPRVTRVGRIIRRWSLDELPQLINILKGDMTLVGPRPTSFPAESYQPWQLPRLEVKPGLTGLWQISGRGEMEFADRVHLDLRYIRERSLRLDLLILLKTPWAVLRGKGAH